MSNGAWSGFQNNKLLTSLREADRLSTVQDDSSTPYKSKYVSSMSFDLPSDPDIESDGHPDSKVTVVVWSVHVIHCFAGCLTAIQGYESLCRGLCYPLFTRLLRYEAAEILKSCKKTAEGALQSEGLSDSAKAAFKTAVAVLEARWGLVLLETDLVSEAEAALNSGIQVLPSPCSSHQSQHFRIIPASMKVPHDRRS